MTSPADLLNQVHTYASRFIAYPDEHSAIAHTLWIAHAHVVNAFDNTPRIAFLSPEPGSGKSRAMEITEHLVPRPVLSVNSSVAYIFRKISDEEGLPTLLMDEVDAIFGKGRTDNNEDLRGLLNSGYRKGAIAGRAAMRGKEVVTEDWPSFCAVAMAGLNRLPDTLMTRSIVIPMKRRKPGQRIEPFRRRVNGPEAEKLMISLSKWTNSVYQHLEGSWPELPEGVEDRDADLWEPIIAIADAAGGAWPDLARNAATAMVSKSKEVPLTLGVQLLTDIQKVFKDLNADRISSNDLVDELCNMPEAPWSNLRGEPIDARFIGKELRRYEITSTTIRVHGQVAKGFKLSDFTDAFARYVTTPEQEDKPLSFPSETGYNGYPSYKHQNCVTPVTDVTVTGEQAEGKTICHQHGTNYHVSTCNTCLQLAKETA